MSEMSASDNESVLLAIESTLYRSKVTAYQDRLNITAPSNKKQGCLSAPAFLWLFGKLKTSTIPFGDLRTIFFSLYSDNGQVRYEVKFCPALEDDVEFSGSGQSQIQQVIVLFELIERLNPEVGIYFEDRTGQFGAFKSDLVKWR